MVLATSTLYLVSQGTYIVETGQRRIVNELGCFQSTR